MQLDNSNNVRWGRLYSLEPYWTSNAVEYNDYRGDVSAWKKCAAPVKNKNKAKKYKVGKVLKKLAWTGWKNGENFYQKTIVTSVSGLKKQKRGKGSKTYYVYWYEYKSRVYCTKYKAQGLLSGMGNFSKLRICGAPGDWNLPTPTEFSISYEDLDIDKDGNIGVNRSKKGYLVRNVKRAGVTKLDISWEMLTSKQAEVVLNALQISSNSYTPWIAVCFFDPKINYERTLKMCAKERSLSATYQGYWTNLSVTLEQY